MIARLLKVLSSARRARKLQRYAIDDRRWQRTLDAYPFLKLDNIRDAARLRELATLFIAEKSFSTTHDLELSDDMIVTIAAQAVLPVLHLGGLKLYRDWVGIIVYPGEFRLRGAVEDELGLVRARDEEASGETFDGGPVVLSWLDVEQTAATPDSPTYNVVIHEFAHKLDMLDGAIDGIPVLLPIHRGHLTREHWQVVLGACWRDWCARCDAITDEAWDTFCAQAPIDPYGCEDPSEFFAVCVETFFMAPERLRAVYPTLHHLMTQYFRPR